MARIHLIKSGKTGKYEILCKEYVICINSNCVNVTEEGTNKKYIIPMTNIAVIEELED